MRKGFTLVELLAVIVILAVLALITTPILLNVIESSRKSTALNSAEGYVRAVSNYLIMNEVSDGLYSVLDNNIKAEYTGTGPSNGSITIKKGDIESANLCINKYSIDYIDGVSSISENDYCKDTNNKTLIIKKNNEQVKKVYIGASTNTSIEKEEGTNVVCNNGVTIKEENNKIKIENILGNSECNFSNNLEDAINNIDNTKNNILLLNDIELGNTLTISEGKDVVMDLNGKSVTMTAEKIAIENKGTLVINDAIGTGSMHTNYRTIDNYGDLIINNGNYTKELTSASLPYAVIGVRSGTTTINNGHFESPDAATIVNFGDMEKNSNLNINGGIITRINSSNTECLGVVTNISRNDGTLTITDKVSKVYIGQLGSSNSIYNCKAVYNLNTNGTIKIKGNIADKCGEEENTSGICVYNVYGRSIGNEGQNYNGKMYIDGVYAVGSEIYIISNGNGVANICNAKLGGGTYDIINAVPGETYYTSKVIFERGDKKFILRSDTSEPILKDDIVCE